MTPRRAGRVIHIFSADAQAVRGRNAWRPNMDIYETDEAVVAALEVPGVKLEDIEIVQQGDRITVRGARRPSVSGDSPRFHQIEIVCGTFERELVLPDTLSGADARASLALGILSLTIPKRGAAQPGGRHTIRIEGQ
jgi:HSP20 family protein